MIEFTVEAPTESVLELPFEQRAARLLCGRGGTYTQFGVIVDETAGEDGIAWSWPWFDYDTIVAQAGGRPLAARVVTVGAHQIEFRTT